MSETICTYGSSRDSVLLAYLYEDIAPEEHEAFERHLQSCPICREELESLAGVRADLRAWAPPEPSFRVAIPPLRVVPTPRPSVAMRLGQIPAWAQVAAAMLFLGAAAGLANLDIWYTNAGLSVRTGWQARTVAAGTAVPATVQADVPSAASVAPWQADLDTLRSELRASEAARTASAVTPAPASTDDVVWRRVRSLVQESEQRQQRELALRVAEIERDVQAQRQADLVKIDRSLAVYQNRTGIEVMRTQQQVNSLAQRVSQRQ